MIRTATRRMSSNRPTTLALLFGINEYPHCNANLTAAVGDADAFEDFLITRLKVPNKHIFSLRDKQASRERILDGFHWLGRYTARHDGNIEVIIYYAGHGVHTGTTFKLCPSDYGALAEGSTLSIDGICERTLSVLLNQILLCRKGIHITVILDCCYSAGMSLRGATSSAGWNPRRMLLYSPKASGQHCRALILLAACGQKQVARENKTSKHGLFTHSLLEVLMSNELENLTYRALMNKLAMQQSLSGQNPHCKGNGINRPLFAINKESWSDTALIYGTVAEDGVITLEAGLAQGITVHTRFSVHKTDLVDSQISPNQPLSCSLVATLVNTYSSTLKLGESLGRYRTSPLPPQFYCKIIGNPGPMLLYTKDKAWLEAIINPNPNPILSMRIVHDPASCFLELTILPGRTVSYNRHNDPAIPHIGPHVSITTHKDDIDALRRVVNAASHFRHHLTRNSLHKIEDVRIELYHLQHDTSNPDFELNPTGGNLLTEEPATIWVGDLDHSDMFGISIVNNSDRALYPSLFYFDPNNFAITELYSPPIVGSDVRLLDRMSIAADAPLPPKSRLPIGYGSSYSTPLTCCSDSNTKDVGFLRLFLSMRPGSFQNLIQEPPFEGSRVFQWHSQPECQWWMVKTATIVQIPRVI
ncbi:hypothetical protein BDN70DRAFT_579021 [Pholiota conissans]|uniref:Peptidase C14 caspase domain-containing protein n=1 Tax=Pholiota conissans TaxID=109636 RepID=A0A9P6CUR0_9AGAR|nr:hypothetical protein BDN70DRAFT_579021 [Pholiota conissans]